MSELYEVLGLEVGASKQKIKAAYKQLAQKYHPDKPEGSPEAFAQIKTAYEILIDDEKRERYDAGASIEISGISTEDEAEKLLLHIFMDKAKTYGYQMLDYGQIIQRDVIDSMNMIKEECQTLKLRRDKIMAIEGKITTEEDENIFSNATKSFIKAIDERLAVRELQLQSGEKALERLKKYGFDGFKLAGPDSSVEH